MMGKPIAEGACTRQVADAEAAKAVVRVAARVEERILDRVGWCWFKCMVFLRLCA